MSVPCGHRWISIDGILYHDLTRTDRGVHDTRTFPTIDESPPDRRRIFLNGMTPMSNTPQDTEIVTEDNRSYLEGVLL